MAYGSNWALTDAKNMQEVELTRLFEVAKKLGPKTHLMVVLAYNGAMRVSELVHVKVSDFNFSTGKISIIPLKKAGKRRVKGRDGKVRTIEKPLPRPIDCPLPPNIMDMVKRYIQQTHLSGTSWLFPGRGSREACHVVKLECPGGHITKRAVQKIFDKACHGAQIKMPGRGIHSLKHARATEVAEKTKDPYLVKEICRHGSVTMSDHYVKYVNLREKVNEIGGRT